MAADGARSAIWAIGQACYTYSTVVYHNVQTAALPSDFRFLVYGIFVLLAGPVRSAMTRINCHLDCGRGAGDARHCP